MRSTRSLIGALGCSALIPFAVASLIVPNRSSHSSEVKVVPVQNTTETEFDVGSLLCADRSLKDPNFAQTVILIVRYDEEGTLGLILNRRSEVPISKVLGDWKEAKGHKEPIFVGGPVEERSLIALARSSAKSDDSPTILRDVHLVSDLGLLQHMLKSAAGPDKFRLYAGYAGWAPEQLEEEVDAGAWHIFPGNANIVFDSDPDTLWMRLIKKTETQIANRSRREVRLPLTS